MSVSAAYFDALHREKSDPFGLRDSWYERRKRELLLAMLSQPSYQDAWEVGCSIGELTAALAPRCAHLLATEGSADAVECARARTREWRQVRIRQARHPRDWPARTFDLIVFSEVGYYFDAGALAELAARFAHSLAADGTFIACHWRHPFVPAPLSGNRVHDILDTQLPWTRTCHYEDADFLLDGWAASAVSIAEREGKR